MATNVPTSSASVFEPGEMRTMNHETFRPQIEKVLKAKNFLANPEVRRTLKVLSEAANLLKKSSAVDGQWWAVSWVMANHQRRLVIQDMAEVFYVHMNAVYTNDRPVGGRSYEIMDTYTQLNQIREAVARGEFAYILAGIDPSDFDTMYRNATILAAYHLVREYPSNPISMRTDRVKDMLASVGATLEDIAFSPEYEREEIKLKADNVITEIRYQMEHHSSTLVSEALNHLDQALNSLSVNNIPLSEVVWHSESQEIERIRITIERYASEQLYFIPSTNAPTTEPIPGWSIIEPTHGEIE